METTLRAIVESMEHAPTCSFHSPSQTHCIACRLRALLDEDEKVDLVKQVGVEFERLYDHAKRCCGDTNLIWVVEDAIKNELAQWLAVNLERIKAEARLEEARWWYYENPLGNQCHTNKEADERIAALESAAIFCKAEARLEDDQELAEYLAKEVWDGWHGPGTALPEGHAGTVADIAKWISEYRRAAALEAQARTEERK